MTHLAILVTVIWLAVLALMIREERYARSRPEARDPCNWLEDKQ